MRKAKMPPKRKPIPAGRRSTAKAKTKAKTKVGKPAAAKVGKAKTAQAVAKGKAVAVKAVVKPQPQKRPVAKDSKAASAPMRPQTKAVEKAPSKVIAASSSKPRPQAPAGGPAVVGSKAKDTKVKDTKVKDTKVKDMKKVGTAERSPERAHVGHGSPPTSESAGTTAGAGGASATERPAEAALPPGLPVPIASFTI
jgi:hypothetical protein